jgi:hypothetical protein
LPRRKFINRDLRIFTERSQKAVLDPADAPCPKPEASWTTDSGQSDFSPCGHRLASLYRTTT